MNDPVEHPAHYQLPCGIEVYDIIAATQSREELIGYCKGNVKKYVLRADRKGGPEDNRKARWYLEKLIELEDAMNHSDSTIRDGYGDVLGKSDPTIPIMHVFEDKATVVVPSPEFGKSGDLCMDSTISFDVSLETAKRLIGSDVRVIVTICDGGDVDV